jgi:excisionase family DNA binding protein
MLTSDLKVALDLIQTNLLQTPKADLPMLLGELERLKAVVWSEMMNTNAHVDQTFLSVPEVAARLNIPASRAYELVRQGKLPGARVGKYVRVAPALLASLART